MIVGKIANSHNDEYYTPEYAIAPLLKYLTPNSRIWCPFDRDESLFVKVFKKNGFHVVNTHIDYGQDFFSIAPPQYDYIISNPPYSKKTEVLQKLFERDVPFAMLVGVVGLFESDARFNMFKHNDFEIMYFNRRVAYFKNYNEQVPSVNPPYSSVYVCHNILPKQIVFEEIDKKGNKKHDRR